MVEREAPYWAVIFTAVRRAKPGDGYAAMNETLFSRVEEQDGFLGYDNYTREDGAGVTISYWESEAAIAAWKSEARHRAAQVKGQTDWYQWYTVEIAQISRVYGFTRPLEREAE